MEKTLPKDGIVEAIVNSGRLTFDDETVIRHHIATSPSKPSSNLLSLSLGLTVASGTVAGFNLDHFCCKKKFRINFKVKTTD